MLAGQEAESRSDASIISTFAISLRRSVGVLARAGRRTEDRHCGDPVSALQRAGRISRQRHDPAVPGPGFQRLPHRQPVLGRVRALRRGLVSRHRVTGIHLRHGRPEQPRVLSGLPDADARRRLGARRPSTGLLLRRHRRLVAGVRCGDGDAVSPRAARSRAAVCAPSADVCRRVSLRVFLRDGVFGEPLPARARRLRSTGCARDAGRWRRLQAR